MPSKPGFLHMLPGLDIVALILIFPLLGSSFMQQTGLQVELPDSPWRFQQMENPILVTLGSGRNHPVWVNKKQIPYDQLETEILRLRSEEGGEMINTVVLQVDQQVSSGFEKEVINRLIKMGLNCGMLGRPTNSR
ncbi:MAG: ExbD/TolR family protein [Akkermansiaceae bacterium]